MKKEEFSTAIQAQASQAERRALALAQPAAVTLKKFSFQHNSAALPATALPFTQPPSHTQFLLLISFSSPHMVFAGQRSPSSRKGGALLHVTTENADLYVSNTDPKTDRIFPGLRKNPTDRIFPELKLFTT